MLFRSPQTVYGAGEDGSLGIGISGAGRQSGGDGSNGTLAALEAAMKADDRQHIAPSMCYAYAALTEGAPFIMGAPNTTVDIRRQPG